MNSLVNTVKTNSGQITSKLGELRQLMSGIQLTNNNSTTNGKMEEVVGQEEQLRQENNELKQQIVECTTKLLSLEQKRLKLLPPKKEKYPLPVPKVISTSKVSSEDVGAEQNNQDTPVVNINAGDQKKKQQPKQQQGQDAATNVKSQVNKKEKKEAKPKKEQPAKSVGGGEDAAAAKVEPVDASRLKFVVGRIIEVHQHPDAEKLYVEKIDLGEPQQRTIISGLVDYVPLEQMQNRLVIVLANLKPAKMRGIVSEGMVMCASNKEANQVQPILPPEGSVAGDRVVFEKYPGQPDDILNPKKKIFEQVAPDLVTDGNGVATYKGDPFLIVGKGVVTSPGMVNIPIR